MVPWAIFFVVDSKDLNEEQHLFWIKVLDTIRNGGTEASLGTPALWDRVQRRGGDGWRDLLNKLS